MPGQPAFSIAGAHTLKVLKSQNNTSVTKEEWQTMKDNLLDYCIRQCLTGLTKDEYQHNGFFYDKERHTGQILCSTHTSAAWWKNAVRFVTDGKAVAVTCHTSTVKFTLTADSQSVTDLTIVRSILVTNLDASSQYGVLPNSLNRVLDLQSDALHITAEIPSDHARDLKDRSVEGQVHWPGGLVRLSFPEGLEDGNRRDSVAEVPTSQIKEEGVDDRDVGPSRKDLNQTNQSNAVSAGIKKPPTKINPTKKSNSAEGKTLGTQELRKRRASGEQGTSEVKQAKFGEATDPEDSDVKIKVEESNDEVLGSVENFEKALDSISGPTTVSDEAELTTTQANTYDAAAASKEPSIGSKPASKNLTSSSQQTETESNQSLDDDTTETLNLYIAQARQRLNDLCKDLGRRDHENIEVLEENTPLTKIIQEYVRLRRKVGELTALKEGHHLPKDLKGKSEELFYDPLSNIGVFRDTKGNLGVFKDPSESSQVLNAQNTAEALVANISACLINAVVSEEEALSWTPEIRKLLESTPTSSCYFEHHILAKRTSEGEFHPSFNSSKDNDASKKPSKPDEENAGSSSVQMAAGDKSSGQNENANKDQTPTGTTQVLHQDHDTPPAHPQAAAEASDSTEVETNAQDLTKGEEDMEMSEGDSPELSSPDDSSKKIKRSFDKVTELLKKYQEASKPPTTNNPVQSKEASKLERNPSKSSTVQQRPSCMLHSHLIPRLDDLAGLLLRPAIRPKDKVGIQAGSKEEAELLQRRIKELETVEDKLKKVPLPEGLKGGPCPIVVFYDAKSNIGIARSEVGEETLELKVFKIPGHVSPFLKCLKLDGSSGQRNLQIIQALIRSTMKSIRNSINIPETHFRSVKWEVERILQFHLTEYFSKTFRSPCPRPIDTQKPSEGTQRALNAAEPSTNQLSKTSQSPTTTNLIQSSTSQPPNISHRGAPSTSVTLGKAITSELARQSQMVASRRKSATNSIPPLFPQLAACGTHQLTSAPANTPFPTRPAIVGPSNSAPSTAGPTDPTAQGCRLTRTPSSWFHQLPIEATQPTIASQAPSHVPRPKQGLHVAPVRASQANNIVLPALNSGHTVLLVVPPPKPGSAAKTNQTAPRPSTSNPSAAVAATATAPSANPPMLTLDTPHSPENAQFLMRSINPTTPPHLQTRTFLQNVVTLSRKTGQSEQIAEWIQKLTAGSMRTSVFFDSILPTYLNVKITMPDFFEEGLRAIAAMQMTKKTR